MADVDLRALERRWRETGDPEDRRRYLLALRRSGISEVDFLRTRVATGELAPERLRLAAALGHAPAVSAGGGEPVAADEAGLVLDALARWGQEALLRAAVASARAALPRWEAVQGGDPARRAVLAAVEQWARCPCRGCQDRVAAASEAVGRDPAPRVPPEARRDPRREAAWWHARAAATAVDALEHVARRAWLRPPPEPVDAAFYAAAAAAQAAEPGSFGSIVREALVPWALGTGDPLRPDRRAPWA